MSCEQEHGLLLVTVWLEFCPHTVFTVAWAFYTRNHSINHSVFSAPDQMLVTLPQLQAWSRRTVWSASSWPLHCYRVPHGCSGSPACPPPCSLGWLSPLLNSGIWNNTPKQLGHMGKHHKKRGGGGGGDGEWRGWILRLKLSASPGEREVNQTARKCDGQSFAVKVSSSGRNKRVTR